jgi:hypothetical protein
MKYDDNNDHGMPMELTTEAYEERMRDEEWADTVNDVLFCMSNGSREDAIEAASTDCITADNWYFEQLLFDVRTLWATMDAACQADVDANH